MTSHARGRNQQRRERDEKDNEKPAHEANFPKDTRVRVHAYAVMRRRVEPFCLRDLALWRAQAGVKPLEVGVTASFDGKHQKLGCLVTVELLETGFES